MNNLIVVSDTHCGCRLGLHPLTPTKLDDGGEYHPSRYQQIVYEWWCAFWDSWVPRACRGEPFAVAMNGDMIDGVHHGATTPISNNLGDQSKIARAIFEPIVSLCGGNFISIRGTEAHVGQSGVDEERLARDLHAIPDDQGRYSRYELWGRVGNALCHIMHHIGTTGSSSYESTAIMKELVEEYGEAGRHRNTPPDIVVRSHRHTYLKVEVPTEVGEGISLTTPGWQLKTPLTYRIAGARNKPPQFGGVLIRQGDEEFFTRRFVKILPRERVEEFAATDDSIEE